MGPVLNRVVGDRWLVVGKHGRLSGTSGGRLGGMGRRESFVKELAGEEME